MSQKEQIISILHEMQKLEFTNQPDLPLVYDFNTIHSALLRIEKEVPDNEWIPVSERLPEPDEETELILANKVR